jgi:hypothetical protein
MSASMSKTFMSPDSLTKTLEEYRELPVLWQVRADYSKRAKRDEAWDLLVQFTKEKIPEADCVLLRKKWTVSGHYLGKNWAEFGIVREAVRLDTEMYERSWESAHACVVKYIRARLPSQARRAGLASQTRTMGSLNVRPRRHKRGSGRVMATHPR